jgi:hypothetical protein
MSIDGLRLGSTGRAVMSESFTKRVRMSFVFEEMMKSRIGAPISRAIHPARTLPKLPVCTLNVAGWANASDAVT